MSMPEIKVQLRKIENGEVRAQCLDDWEAMNTTLIDMFKVLMQSLNVSDEQMTRILRDLQHLGITDFDQYMTNSQQYCDKMKEMVISQIKDQISDLEDNIETIKSNSEIDIKNNQGSIKNLYLMIEGKS